MDVVRKEGNGKGARPCFLLVEPKGSCNSDEMAAKLARCKGVREVHLTSGRFAFVVSATADSEKELGEISTAVKKAAKSGSVSVAMSHFVYR